jgi:hypothetical protein
VCYTRVPHAAYLHWKNYVLSDRKLSSTLGCQKSSMLCNMNLLCCMTWNFYVRRVNKKVWCHTAWKFHVTGHDIFWHPSVLVLVSFLLLNTQFFYSVQLVSLPIFQARHFQIFSGVIVLLLLAAVFACSSERFVHNNILYHFTISDFFMLQQLYQFQMKLRLSDYYRKGN